ncbi:unnamed protein product, partial [marine sediment metagenome]
GGELTLRKFFIFQSFEPTSQTVMFAGLSIGYLGVK